jgi:hypothetical protein
VRVSATSASVRPSRFGFVKLAPTGRVAGDDRVGSAPLQDRVRPMAQLSLDDQTLDDVDRRAHVLVALPVRLEREMATDGIQVALEIIDAPEVENIAFRPQRSERGFDFPALRFSNISRPFSERSASAASANSSCRYGTMRVY